MADEYMKQLSPQRSLRQEEVLRADVPEELSPQSWLLGISSNAVWGKKAGIDQQKHFKQKVQ